MCGSDSHAAICLNAGSAAAIAIQLPVFAWRQARSEAACVSRPRFFTDAEDYRTLEALVDRLIPEDTDESAAVSYGAKRAKVADYVDFLLGSFLCTMDTPFIYAGRSVQRPQPPRVCDAATHENVGIGFRLAMIPEPGTAALFAVGLVGLAMRRRG